MKILAIGDFHGKLSVKLKKAVEKEKIDLIIGVGDYAGVEDWRPYVLHCLASKKTGKRKSPEEFFGKVKFEKLMEKDFNAGEDILDFLDSLGVPFVSIFGNGDDEWYDYPFDDELLSLDIGRRDYLKGLKNFVDITYGVVDIKGVSILGLGGYVDAEENYDEEERDSLGYFGILMRLDKTRRKLKSLIRKVKGKSKIFVFHYPVKGVFDVIEEKGNVYRGKSVGMDFFREAVEKEKPGLVLCGHMHEYQGSKKLKGSLIVNPGAALDGKAAVVDFDEGTGKVKSVEFLG